MKSTQTLPKKFKISFIGLVLMAALPLPAQNNNLSAHGLDPLEPFLGSYTYTMGARGSEVPGTLEVQPALDGSYIEWEFYTEGMNPWHLRILTTWDNAAGKYRLWRFDTRALLPPGANEGTGEFSNNEFVMKWLFPAEEGGPWLFRNQVRMINDDTIEILTVRERGEVRQQGITTARRSAETTQVKLIPVKKEPPSRYVTTEELLSQPPRDADHRIAYGTDPLNFGDLRIPESEGPHPVVILIHGGCWLSMASLNQFDSFAEELTDHGLATWNISYRKVDDAGGGFPGTFMDVAAGVDHLRELAKSYNLDLDRVYLIGHSAGGHLATWAAARARIAKTSPLYTPYPLTVNGLVNIAGPLDLEALIPRDEGACGMKVIEPLMGGSPEDVPEHYASGSPAEMLPLGVRQLHLVGGDDQVLPFVREFASQASAAGDDVEIVVIPGAGHHDLIAPWSTIWPKVPPILNRFFNTEN